MTLSQFLRDYLYIPLGGNRHGRVLRYVNLMITMLLGGLWHGAAWTFVVWGALHGVYLCINHAWNHFGPAVAPRFARLADIAGVRSDVSGGRRRLGILPRRQHATALSVLSKMADPIAYRLWPRRNAPTRCSSRFMLRSPGSRRTRRRSWATTTRTGRVGETLGAWRMRPLFLYASAAVLAFGILGIQQHSEFIYFRF